MIASKHLYRNFLNDRRVYNLNRGYWRRILSKLGDNISIPFYKEYFANGTAFYDGNPIISAYIPELKKSIRIIQEEPECEEIELGAWTEATEVDNKNIEELVITLELSKEASKVAKELITAWLQEDLNDGQIDNILGKVYSS